jgi:hypothetical protein
LGKVAGGRWGMGVFVPAQRLSSALVKPDLG